MMSRYLTNNLSQLLIISLFMGSITTCSLFNPQITLIDQKTALENQILGTYQQLDKDMMMLASVRALDEQGEAKKPEAQSNLHEKAMKSMQNQEFNRDDIDEYKQKQVIGESNTGLVVILDDKSLNAETQTFVKKLVAEENQDREVIWQRIIQLSEQLSEKDISNIKKTYAKMQAEHAPKGTKIQEENGQWTIKP